MLTSAPPVAAVLPGLLAFAEGSVLAAHNAPFDLRFLTAACAGMGRDWPGFEVLDTVRLARHLMATPQEVPDRKLATLATFFGTPVRPSHRALDDARATAAVLGELLGRLTDREGVMTLDDLDAWLAARDAEAAARRPETVPGTRRARSRRGTRSWLACWPGCGDGCLASARVSSESPAASVRAGGPDTIALCRSGPPARTSGGTGGRSPGKQHSGRQPVVTAIVLLKAEIHRIPEVAEAIAQLPAVSEVYSITGDYDLVAIVRVRAPRRPRRRDPRRAQQGGRRDRHANARRVPRLLPPRP